MGAYRALADSVREINQMMLDTQQFQGRMALENAKLNVTKAQNLEAAKDRALKREKLQYEVNNLREMNTPQDYSLGSYVGQDPMIWGNANALSQMQTAYKTILGKDVVINPDTQQVLTADGKPHKANVHDLRKILPTIRDIGMAYEQSPTQMTVARVRAQEKLADVESQIKALGTDTRQQNKLTDLMTAKAELTKAVGTADRFLSNQGQMLYYDQKWKWARNAQLQAGRNKLPGLAEYFGELADDYDKQRSSYRGAVQDERRAALKDAKGGQMYSVINSEGEVVHQKWYEKGSIPEGYPSSEGYIIIKGDPKKPGHNINKGVVEVGSKHIDNAYKGQTSIWDKLSNNSEGVRTAIQQKYTDNFAVDGVPTTDAEAIEAAELAAAQVKAFIQDLNTKRDTLDFLVKKGKITKEDAIILSDAWNKHSLQELGFVSKEPATVSRKLRTTGKPRMGVKKKVKQVLEELSKVKKANAAFNAQFAQEYPELVGD